MTHKLIRLFKYFLSVYFIYDIYLLFQYFLTPKGKKKIVYIIPGTGLSGGIAVIVQHANRLIKKGYKVLLVTTDNSINLNWIKCDALICPYSSKLKFVFKNADLLIATAWSTVEFLDKIPSKRKLYFVQSDERRFFKQNEEEWIQKVENTYKKNCEFFTMAKWIQKWLKEEFDKDSYYVPNGIDLNCFYKVNSIEEKNKPFRILLEGPTSLWFKGMDDAYEATKDLDCEIWMVSALGKPKNGWKIDNFFEHVPIEQMKSIYSSCDFLLKMSRVESFSSPPLEAMACGCIPIITNYTGYTEYLINEKNGLVVDIGDTESARKAIIRLMKDQKLREYLLKDGTKTVKKWSWDRSIDYLEDVINKRRIKKYYTKDDFYSYTEQRKIIYSK